MIVLTLDDLDALKQPIGTPCSCGGGAAEHTTTRVYPTPKRWAMRKYHHWQSATGIWWTGASTPRYYATKESAVTAAARGNGAKS